MTYTNDLGNVSISSNETIGFSMDSGECRGFVGFTPEFYCWNSGNLKGLTMMTFKGGEAWFHNIESVSNYNSFYLTQTNQYIRIICNESPKTVKRFLAIGLDSINLTSSIEGVKYKGDFIVTSANQESNLPQECFKFLENWLYADFRRATNLGGNLQTGQGLRGSYLEINLKRDDDPDVVGTYSQFSKAAIFFMTSEKSIK